MLTILNILLGLKLMTISAEMCDLSTLSNSAPFGYIKMKQSLKLFSVASISLQIVVQIAPVVSEISVPNVFPYRFIYLEKNKSIKIYQ